MSLLLIPLYLLIGALLDYVISDNPGENIWVPMIFWPVILSLILIALLFRFMERIAKFLVDILGG